MSLIIRSYKISPFRLVAELIVYHAVERTGQSILIVSCSARVSVLFRSYCCKESVPSISLLISIAYPGNSDVKQLEDEIYAEIRGRIKEDDIDAPLRKGQYYYYERTLAGKEYAQHCRRLVPPDAPITVHDMMPTGPDAPVEHIILDENVKAEGHDYYSIGAFKVNLSV